MSDDDGAPVRPATSMRATQLAGIALAVLGTISVAAFLYLALSFEVPRMPPRQVGDETYTTFNAIRAGCGDRALEALPPAERQIKTDECAAEQEHYRLQKEGLGQAARTTDATEEGVRVAFQQARIGFAQAILTVFALAFTGWAAFAASRAARAAELTLGHADAVMRNELRAYVHVDQAELRWGAAPHPVSRPSVSGCLRLQWEHPHPECGSRTVRRVGLPICRAVDGRPVRGRGRPRASEGARLNHPLGNHGRWAHSAAAVGPAS